jgi:hypothetical protein
MFRTDKEHHILEYCGWYFYSSIMLILLTDINFKLYSRKYVYIDIDNYNCICKFYSIS